MRPAATIATAAPSPSRATRRATALLGVLGAGVLLLATARSAAAQLPDRIERQGARTGYVNLSGPRAGVLFLADDDRLRDEYDVNRVVTQLGVALETRMFAVPEGPTGVAQLVALAGVGDGGGNGARFVPSGMLLLGLRTQGGFEVSVGPWFAERDAAAVLQLGAVLPAGYMRIPFHVQLMPTNNGLRVGFMTGFNALR